MPTPDLSYREIPLTKGQVALVDAEDYERIAKYKWHASWKPKINGYYAQRAAPRSEGMNKTISMSRQIMGIASEDERHVDHKSRNTLDNRKENLRIATLTQNNRNRGMQRNNTSGFKGVVYIKDRKKWRASVVVNKKAIYIGIFQHREDASAAYLAAAQKMHGEFAYKI